MSADLQALKLKTAANINKLLDAVKFATTKVLGDTRFTKNMTLLVTLEGDLKGLRSSHAHRRLQDSVKQAEATLTTIMDRFNAIIKNLSQVDDQFGSLLFTL